MPVTYKKIASISVGSGGSTSIEFTNVPTTYDDLILLTSLRGDISNVIGKLTFNSNASNYSYRMLSGNGTAMENTSSASAAFIVAYGLYNSSSWTSSVFANASIYIPNYAGSTNKSVSIDTVAENNDTSAYQTLTAGLWANTSAITSVKIDLNSAGNFVQHSSAVLYGIKKS